MIKFRACKMLDTAGGRLPLDIAFELGKGRLLTLYGNSGAGKTTILRIIAGLTSIEDGYIEVDGQVWYDHSRGKNTPPQKRAVGMVFQDFALFPNLTVRENIAFAMGRDPDTHRLAEMLELMDLQQLQNNRPNRLSGGQRQRVALARAIARKPVILLLDEPLSAVDETMRVKLQEYILKVHRHYQLTSILVSHDLSEIHYLSDEVIFIEKGKIQSRDCPSAFFNRSSAGNQFSAEGVVTEVVPVDQMYMVSISCMNTIIKMIATAEEAKTISVGQQVLVSARYFNPVITPAGTGAGRKDKESA